MSFDRPSATLPLPVTGDGGAVCAAHPLAVTAGLAMLDRGGTAVDAAIAAHAVLAVVSPGACGLGGDGLALVAEPSGAVTAVNGTGRAPRKARRLSRDGGASVTVPGLIHAWGEMSSRWGRLGLAVSLGPATRHAVDGIRVTPGTASGLAQHRARLERGGAKTWPFFGATPGQRVVQPRLAATLTSLREHGPDSFYQGSLAEAVSRAAQTHGGALDALDLAEHDTVVREPIAVGWNSATAYTQPPMSQGVLLAMALRWLEHEQGVDASVMDHLGVELIEAVFCHRDRVQDGEDLLLAPLAVDSDRAGRRGGPRGYLHTAGVTAVDAEGMVVSSLVSVFDGFGSACYVPEGGFTLNNRAAGFTSGPNAPRAGARPVHTLAPLLLRGPDELLALATPGADGQVQTLLQVLCNRRYEDIGLNEAIDKPRWRSEDGRLLIERAHRRIDDLRRRGHDVVVLEDGDPRFGAVVAAGVVGGVPTAIGDWRRQVTVGVR